MTDYCLSDTNVATITASHNEIILLIMQIHNQTNLCAKRQLLFVKWWLALKRSFRLEF